MLDLLIRRCRLPERDTPVDVGIADAAITAIGTVAESARETIDARGRLLTPGLVESHIHLDKALLAGRVATAAGTLEEAIQVTGDAKRRFTVDDIRARARRVLNLAVAAGTTAMRTHVEVDPILGLAALDAIRPLREEYAPAIDLQICAFAQEGIVKSPGTEELLRRALGGGADLVGGCPYNDTDARTHIRTVFALARSFDVDADFHVDFFDEPEHLHVRDIIEETIAQGWEGRVAVGHLTELAALDEITGNAIIAALADARIGVIALPATDLYLMGRSDAFNVRRGLAPLRRLLRAGVSVALATNNVRNPFTPVGTADLAHQTFVAAVAGHMGSDADLRDLLRMITEHPAQILRRDRYGIVVGARADLVLWDAERPEDIAAALQARVAVVKAGRVSIECEARVRWRWREEVIR